ncbi:type II toxin-antitoxin system ParD family antitoxin [Rudaeicoccus suwonensis]|nr:type II toxin-antitoxin system ParD family antitoxin [Rudaeicoccus suwonensis]
MDQNISIGLDDHLVDFMARAVESGRYRSASDVVCASLRLLQDRETQMASLRAAIIAGEASGPLEAFDFDHFLASKNG